jgi:hypothetical protein
MFRRHAKDRFKAVRVMLVKKQRKCGQASLGCA